MHAFICWNVTYLKLLQFSVGVNWFLSTYKDNIVQPFGILHDEGCSVNINCCNLSLYKEMGLTSPVTQATLLPRWGKWRSCECGSCDSTRLRWIKQGPLENHEEKERPLGPLQGTKSWELLLKEHEDRSSGRREWALFRTWVKPLCLFFVFHLFLYHLLCRT